MSIATRRAAALAVDALCGVVGRRHAVRAARFALHRARRDVPNAPDHNGEYGLQRWMLAVTPSDVDLVVFDVGANVGDWSLTFLGQEARAGRTGEVSLHAFEPCSSTYAMLCGRVPDGVTANRLALSDGAGERSMYVVAPGCGVNSLHRRYDADHVPATTETVRTERLDDYAAHNGIERIDLLKIDTEGHDFSVLLGARAFLRDRRIALAQFEYNHRWISSRCYLRDVFELVDPYGYAIGKLTPDGIEMYDSWDPDLETFVEGNYVICSPPIAARLPHVRWWKSAVGPSRTRGGSQR